jgi:(p)ppGpp synthase/HD superfamily hydrolase
MREPAEDEEIERAIRYLVGSFEASGDNPKPVILHSTRAGMNPYDRGYEKRIVVSGFLHDLPEDTDVTADEVRSEFGGDVADVVEAVGYDEDIDDYLERHYDIYERCFELGRDAVVVKAADILDNGDYYGLADSERLRRNLVTEMSSFVDDSEPYIGDEDLHEELREKLSVMRERVNGVGED